MIGVGCLGGFESGEDDYSEKIVNEFIEYWGKGVLCMEGGRGDGLEGFGELIRIEE